MGFKSPSFLREGFRMGKFRGCVISGYAEYKNKTSSHLKD